MNPSGVKTIAFFGASGSGKGTQAQLLIQYLHETYPDTKVHFIEVGKLLREMALQENETGERIKNIMDNGKLVPPFWAIYAWTQFLIKHVVSDDFVIFDGAARSIPEAQAFADAMDFYERSYTAIALTLSAEDAIKRIEGRGEGRADDADVEKIKRRLAWFEDSVKPALEYLEERGADIQYIDGAPSIEKVHEVIKETLSL